MPQIEQPQAISNGESALPRTWAEKIDFSIGFLRRRYVTILIFLVPALLFAAAYLLVAPPTYTASTTMMIDARNSQILQQSTTTAAAGQVDSAWIDSQIGILKSQNVAAYLVKQLRLAEDPKFTGSAGLIDKLFARLGRQASEPKSEAERAGDAIGVVSSGLDVRRVGQSYMININFSSHNPELAAKVANAVIDAYIYDQLNAKFQANRSASGWLQERLEALRGQAAAAERAVIEFKDKNKMVAVSGTLMNEKQLTEISGQLATAHARTADLKAKLDRIEIVRRAYQQGQPTSAVDESVSDELNSAIITRLRGQYLDLVNREADYSARYGKDHYAVVTLRNQIRDIRRSIGDELGRIAETYKSDYEIAKKRENEAETAMAGLISQSQETNQAQVALFALQAAAQSYRKIYDSFLQQYTQSVQQQSFPITEARAISSASVSKTSPRTLQVWLLATFAGGMLGFGFAVFREIMDRGFRTRDQVQSLLHTECLAMVPRLSAPSMTISPGWQSMIAEPTRKAGSAIVNALRVVEPKRAHSALQNNLWAAFKAPSSLYAEALRSIKLSVDLRDQGTSNVIGLTSCFPGEGKSTIAAGVAALIAEGGANVILVDCDLRNPSLTRALAPHAGVGFLDAIAGTAALSSAVQTDPTTNLHFLPAVRRNKAARLPHAVEALASGAARSLVNALKARYDLVIIDLPPLIAGSDNRAASGLIDSYILVIEWGSTKVDAVQYALRHSPAVHERIIGGVLNKVDLATVSRYDNYGAHYYYGRSGRPDLVN